MCVRTHSFVGTTPFIFTVVGDEVGFKVSSCIEAGQGGEVGLRHRRQREGLRFAFVVRRLFVARTFRIFFFCRIVLCFSIWDWVGVDDLSFWLRLGGFLGVLGKRARIYCLLTEKTRHQRNRSYTCGYNRLR